MPASDVYVLYANISSSKKYRIRIMSCSSVMNSTSKTIMLKELKIWKN